MASTSPAERLAAVFRKVPVVDMPALARALPDRSRRSFFRDLSALGYVASYSHAGRYYTLREAAPFDRDGLWLYQGIGFSRYGTLKETSFHLVEAADAGWTHEELETRVRIRVHNTLLDLVRHGRLGREPLAGLYVYVSGDPARGGAQLLARRRRLATPAPPEPLPALVVIEVLVEVIQGAHARASPASIAERLAARGVLVTIEQVERVFREHGIQKKGLRSRSRRSPP
jgi:hypothetical protein